MYHFTSCYGKIIGYLELENVPKAKEALIQCNKIGLKAIQEGHKGVKVMLYRFYFQYYSNPLVGNVKKSFQNYAEWLKVAIHDSRKYIAIFKEFHVMSSLCIENRAYRQHEYFLRVIKTLLDQKKPFLDTPKAYKLKLILQEVNHTRNLIIDSLMLDNDGNFRKFCDFFISFEIPDVPVVGDSILTGSAKNFTKYRELHLKCWNELKKAKKMLEIAQNELTLHEAICVKNNIEKSKQQLIEINDKFKFNNSLE